MVVCVCQTMVKLLMSGNLELQHRAVAALCAMVRASSTTTCSCVPVAHVVRGCVPAARWQAEIKEGAAAMQVPLDFTEELEDTKTDANQEANANAPTATDEAHAHADGDDGAAGDEVATAPAKPSPRGVTNPSEVAVTAAAVVRLLASGTPLKQGSPTPPAGHPVIEACGDFFECLEYWDSQ